MQAAVHPHAAQWIVDVRGIARQENIAVAITPGHPLMHPVDGAMADRVVAILGRDALQRGLGMCVRHDHLIRHGFRNRNEHAPQLGHPQKHEPLVGVGHVVDVAQIVETVFERVRRGDTVKLFRKCQPLELDVQPFSDDRIGTIAGDQVTPAMVTNRKRRLGCQAHACGILCDVHHFLVEAKFDVGHGGEQFADMLHHFPLLALQAVGIAHRARQQPEIEGKDLAGGTIAMLKHRGFQATWQQPFEQPQVFEHVERRRVKGRCAQVFGGRRKAFDHRHGHALPGQPQGADQSNRACTGNQHPLCVMHPRLPWNRTQCRLTAEPEHVARVKLYTALVAHR